MRAIQIYYSYIQEGTTPMLLNKYLKHIPPELSSRIQRFCRVEDAMLSLMGKLLLQLAFKPFGVNILNELRYNKYNRPFIDNELYDFNLSHSGSMVICAVAFNCKVGIDVEKKRLLILDNYKSALNNEEWTFIQHEDNSYDKFFELWTKKEAVAKADGRGMQIPFKEIYFRDDMGFVFSERYFLKRIHIHNDYVIHMATDNNCPFPIVPVNINFK